MLLLLTRHAVTAVTGKKLTGWLPGFSLSDDGKRQAGELAARLSSLPIKAVYSSPLERCFETAEMIADPHRLKVSTDERIGEIRYGEWQGKPLKTLYRTKAWRELRARPADFRFPGGETVREAQLRGMAAIEDLRKKHSKAMVVVCSHADLIRVVVAGYIGLPLDLYSRISVAPASISALQIGSFGGQLLRLGDSGSLDDVVERWKASIAPRRNGAK